MSRGGNGFRKQERARAREQERERETDRQTDRDRERRRVLRDKRGRRCLVCFEERGREGEQERGGEGPRESCAGSSILRAFIRSLQGRSQ